MSRWLVVAARLVVLGPTHISLELEIALKHLEITVASPRNNSMRVRSKLAANSKLYWSWAGGFESTFFGEMLLLRCMDPCAAIFCTCQSLSLRVVLPADLSLTG